MLKPHLLHPAALAHPPLAQTVSRFSLNKLGVAARLAILAGVSGTLLLGLAPSAQAQSPEQSVTTTKNLSIPAGSLARRSTPSRPRQVSAWSSMIKPCKG